MRVNLRDEVVTKKKVDVKFRKAALDATTCDACGQVYKMSADGCPSYCSRGNGVLIGTFNKAAVTEEGGPAGCGFEADVCSFACADKIMRGDWRTIKKYRPFARAGARLMRCELGIHCDVKTEQDLLSAWEREEPSVVTHVEGTWNGSSRTVLG